MKLGYGAVCAKKVRLEVLSRKGLLSLRAQGSSLYLRGANYSKVSERNKNPSIIRIRKPKLEDIAPEPTP